MSPKESLIKSLISDGYLKTPRIIEAFRAIDRADFVLPEYKNDAYGNHPLPIGAGQTISQPLTVAFMLELLEPHAGEKILDIGAGSGWQTSLLANIVGEKGQITAVERIPELCEFAQKNLAKYNLLENGRVKFYCQDATAEIPNGPYDKIIAAAAASRDIPELWRGSLKIGGRIVAPVGGSIWLFIKKSETEWEKKEFPGFAFVPLISDKKQEIKKTPEKNSRQKFIKPLFAAFLLFAYFTAVGANEIYFYRAPLKTAKSVEIQSGLGSRQIAEVLKKEGVIRSKWAFVTYASLKGQSSNLKPGSYIFGRASIPEITRDLVKGGTNEKLIVIPEGWNIRDIAIYFENQGMFQQEELMELAGLPNTDYSRAPKNIPRPKDFSNKFDFLNDKPKAVGLEGYLFPDTYRVFKDAGLEKIIIKMLENFGKKLTPELREEIKKQKKTIFEIITMASLIEKEVITDNDRAVVSGILWERLELGIPLQVDATISYITNKKNISAQDKEINSPYNTYKYSGLPLGPISNPGISAIRAAIFPQKSPYLYYLSAPDGRTIFSETLEEHNAAKAKYLK